MALTIANLAYTNQGSQWQVTGTIAFDSSYPTGGESLTAANIGLALIDSIVIHPTSGMAFEYDYTNSKVIAYEQGFTTGSTAVTTPIVTSTSALIENSAGTESVVRLIGPVAIDTAYQLGKMVQVASTTDLSGITGVRFRAVGV